MGCLYILYMKSLCRYDSMQGGSVPALTSCEVRGGQSWYSLPCPINAGLSSRGARPCMANPRRPRRPRRYAEIEDQAITLQLSSGVGRAEMTWAAWGPSKLRVARSNLSFTGACRLRPRPRERGCSRHRESCSLSDPVTSKCGTCYLLSVEGAVLIIRKNQTKRSVKKICAPTPITELPNQAPRFWAMLLQRDLPGARCSNESPSRLGCRREGSLPKVWASRVPQ